MINLPLNQFPIISTNRLKLRRLVPEDLDRFFKFALSDGYPVKSKELALEKILNTEMNYQSGECINWGIEHRGVLIGTIGYYRGFMNDIGEVGYGLDADYHRMGIMTEALHAVIDFGFNKLNLLKITAYTPIENVPSVNLLEKLEFRNTSETFERYTIFEKLTR